MGCKFAYNIKEGTTESEPMRYKARFVAKNYTHKEGMDNVEIFSSIVQYTIIRVMLAFVAYYDWELELLDVKIPFCLVILMKRFLWINRKIWSKPGLHYVCFFSKKKKSLFMGKNSLHNSGIKTLIPMWYLLVLRGVSLILHELPAPQH